eukprot:gene45365-56505_t
MTQAWVVLTRPDGRDRWRKSTAAPCTVRTAAPVRRCCASATTTA